MVSSASAQIEATGGDHLKTTIIKNGKRTVVPDYARVQGILIGTVAAYILLLTIIGPEYVLLQGIHHRDISDFNCRVNRNHGADFERHGLAFSEETPGNNQHDVDEKVSETRSEDIKEKV